MFIVCCFDFGGGYQVFHIFNPWIHQHYFPHIQSQIIFSEVRLVRTQSIDVLERSTIQIWYPLCRGYPKNIINCLHAIWMRNCYICEGVMSMVDDWKQIFNPTNYIKWMTNETQLGHFFASHSLLNFKPWGLKFGGLSQFGSPFNVKHSILHQILHKFLK